MLLKGASGALLPHELLGMALLSEGELMAPSEEPSTRVSPVSCSRCLVPGPLCQTLRCSRPTEG